MCDTSALVRNLLVARAHVLIQGPMLLIVGLVVSM
jgi:hypothetical protein